MSVNVHPFRQGEATTDAAVLERLGIRGREAMELASLKLPILPGFVIDANSVVGISKEPIRELIVEQFETIEPITGKEFGSVEGPMLVKLVISPNLVIAQYPFLHNFGLTDATLGGFANFVGDAFAHQEMLFLIRGMLEIEIRIAELAESADHKKLVAAMAGLQKDHGLNVPLKRTQAAIAKVRPLMPKGFFADAHSQLEAALKRVAHMLDLDDMDNQDTAILVQPMVHGNYGRESATGNFFTRSIITGDNQLQGRYFQDEMFEAHDAVGEDINKISAEHLKELERVARTVEDKYREIRSIRFTIENRRLWLNDQRSVMSKSTQAVIKTLLDLRERKVVDDEYVVKNVEPGQLNEILHPIVDMRSIGKLKALQGGVSGAPGAAIGRVFFSTDALLEEYKLAQVRQSDARLILCMGATYAEDVKAIEVAAGVLSSEGGYAAHASVVARQYGKVSLVRDDMSFSGGKATIGKVTLKEGDYVTMSVAFFGEPVVYLGKAELIEPAPETSGLLEYLEVVNGFVGDFHVRANADTPRDATLAYNFGAGGIGLCRTEHMFFAEDRINVFRQLIMASSLGERRKVLAKLLPMQRKDFYGLFKAMKGKPVTIRLMDAPLHEFLPHNAGEMKNFLTHLNAGRAKKVTQKEVELISESLHEFNPMLGHRGCRLSVSYPEIYEMQMRAIFEAAFKLQKEKFPVHPEIMVPLIMNEIELKLIIFGKKIEGSSIKGLIDVEAEVRKELKARPIPFPLGTMIELPVAALAAGEIARYAQFFSFGTNDLTQTTMGLSRDDYTSFMPDYTLYDILDSNPFQVLNKHVKELVAVAAKRGRLTRPDLKTGLCGEHGAIPENIRFCMEAGLDYVSCSSYSVPIAKLAVAQINLGM
jgi:pyruvate,orthophosphate dikinase